MLSKVRITYTYHQIKYISSQKYLSSSSSSSSFFIYKVSLLFISFIELYEKVKQDLEKIDLLIDQDVLILRSKIDALAVDVSQAHAQMVKKEKEYTQAKQLYDKRFNEKVYTSFSLSLAYLPHFPPSFSSIIFLPLFPPSPSPSLPSLSPYRKC